MLLEARKYVLDAARAGEAVASFTAAKTFTDYENDLLLRSAVERQLEILGEAFSRLDRLSPEYRGKYPALAQIIGMRNRIIHGYDSVDDAIVWDAVQNHLPPLMSWLRSLDL